MTIEINFENGAEIQHLNVRKEGDEKEILACDVKMNGTVPAQIAATLLGVVSTINPGGTRDVLQA